MEFSLNFGLDAGIIMVRFLGGGRGVSLKEVRH